MRRAPCTAMAAALLLGAAPAAWAEDAGTPVGGGAAPGGPALPEIALVDAGPDGLSDAGAGEGTAPAKAGEEKPAWAPRLTATVRPVQVKLGDPITVQIKVRHKPDVSVNLPLKLELGQFNEISRKEGTRQLGAAGEIPEVERTFTLEVAAYELGELTLPPVEVTALGPRGEMITLTTAEMQIDVKSVMSNEPQPKLKALEPPVSVFQRTWWLVYLIIGLAAAGLVAVVTLLVARHLRERRRREAPPPPPIPPHVIALERLDAMEVERLIEEERYKELYLELSEIVRGYIGGRWEFDALEMTSSEIREALVGASVEDGLRMRLETYFNECDLVKFAKYTPDPEPAMEAAAEARAIVVDTMQTVGDAPRPDEHGGGES